MEYGQRNTTATSISPGGVSGVQYILYVAEPALVGSRVLASGGVPIALSDTGSAIQINIDISSLTEDSTPDTANDFVMTYDASAGGHKKVKLSSIGLVISYVIHGNAGADATWTNMPAAATLLFGSTRHIGRLDLSKRTQVRFVMTKGSVAGASGSKIILRYYTAWSSTVGDYLDIGTSEVSLATDGGIDGLVTSWVDLAAGAKADVWIAVVGSGGDGALDPTFGTIRAEFR